MMFKRALGVVLLGLASSTAFAGSNGTPSPASQSSTAVTVQLPVDGSTSSPAVHVQASASVSNSVISAMVVNVDSKNLYQTGGGSVNTTLTLAAGNHQIYVKAWDNHGRYYDKVLHITVANTPSGGGNGYKSNHVFVLMLENRSDAQALANMPYLSGLARQYGMATKMYSATHGSWLAYGELTAGIAPAGGEALHNLCNGYGCSSPINAPNLVRQLAKDGKSWKGYFQSLPTTGWMGDSYKNYARKHNPFPFFSDVAHSSSQQKNMVDDQQLGTDLNVGDIANYNLIVPDLAHDGHNPSTTSTALSNADNYLAGLLPQLLGSSYFRPGGDGVLIVTFDESDLYNDNTCGTTPETNNCGGHIFLTMIGPKVKKSFQSATHHLQRDVLKTSCDLLGLSACPGDGAQGVGMSEFFTSSTSGGGSGTCAAPGSPGVHVCAPVASQSYGTSVQITGAGAGASGAVNHMELWIDGRKINNYFSNQVNTSVTLSSGKHAATLVEVDNRGAYIKSNPVSFTSR